jgi:hypothetical protein
VCVFYLFKHGVLEPNPPEKRRLSAQGKGLTRSGHVNTKPHFPVELYINPLKTKRICFI